MKLLRISLVVLFAVVGTLVAAGPALAQTFDEAGNDISQGPAPPPPPTPPAGAPAPPPAAGCVDNDLQTSATGTSSGGGETVFGFGPELANDGVLGPPDSCDGHWIGAGSAANGEWYELTWPAAVDICQIFVDTKPQPAECVFNPNRILSDATIQWWDGAAWVTEATVAAQTDDWEYVFTGCVTTTRLRLFDVFTDPAQGFQESNPVLYELKVYGREAACVPASPLLALALLALLLVAAGLLTLSRRQTGAHPAGL